MLMEPNLHVYTGQHGNLMKEPPSVVPLILANLTFPFLVHLFSKGVRAFDIRDRRNGGGIIIFPDALYVGFSFFAFFQDLQELTPLLSDLAVVSCSVRSLAAQ